MTLAFALEHIEGILDWWREHRAGAPAMLLDDLTAAGRLLTEHPEAGIVYATQRTGLVRRILLSGTKYHLYYRYEPQRREVVVLAIWGASRRRGPKL